MSDLPYTATERMEDEVQLLRNVMSILNYASLFLRFVRRSENRYTLTLIFSYLLIEHLDIVT